MNTAVALVNFGGPRSQDEILPFLQELLCDPDVIRSRLPIPLHRMLFRRVAKKRALTVSHDYAMIGGKSPIFFDTEFLCEKLRKELNLPIVSFHRYLPETHTKTLKLLENISANSILVLPLFPQFTFATSGSIARFFSKHLSTIAQQKLRWIPSYADHPLFINAFQKTIENFLQEKNLREDEIYFLFSAHGLPERFIEDGDPYKKECEDSFQKILQKFPQAKGKLCFQSKFGKGQWLEPATDTVSLTALTWNEGRRQIVFIPLSFTSDHIETLFEVEEQYMPLIRKQGLHAHRCPALNRDSHWISALCHLVQDPTLAKTSNDALIFRQ